MTQRKLPELDRSKKGIFEGYLRSAFVRAMERIASNELLELTRKAISLRKKIYGTGHLLFSQLKFLAENPDSFDQSGQAIHIHRYVSHILEWARAHNVQSDWYLDSLHRRIELLAVQENLYEQRLIEIQNSHPIQSVINDYPVIVNDSLEIEIRKQLLLEILEIMNVDTSRVHANDLLKVTYDLLITKTSNEIHKLEDNWRLRLIRKLEDDESYIRKGVQLLSNNFGFITEVNNFKFNFESDPWQFNEERRRSYTERIKEKFSDALRTYLDSVEMDAIERGHKKIKPPQENRELSLDDRLNLFVFYQFKNQSPDECLDNLQELYVEEGRDQKGELTASAVTKIVQQLAKQLGFVPRPSKTLKKN